MAEREDPGTTLRIRLRSFALPAALFVLASAGCGDDDSPPAGLGGGAKAGAGAASGGAGRAGRAGSAGSAAGGESGVSGESGRGGSSAGAAPEGGTAGATGGGAGETGEGQAGEGGRGGGGGTGATSGAGGAPSFDCEDAGAELPQGYDPLCDPAAQWGPSEPVPIMASGSDMLSSLTPDELSIGFSAEDGFGVAFFVADREGALDPFGTPQKLADPALASAQRIALSPDGLRVIAAADGLFVSAVRSTREEAFGAFAEGECAELDAQARAVGQVLGDPVIAADDLVLYYSVVSGAGATTLFVSTRTGSEPWPPGTPLDQCELNQHPLGVRLPTGVSADGLTLFFFDTARGVARAGFRAATDAPFARFVDLPGYGSQPNAACDRLYYSLAGDLPLGVVVSERD